MTNIQLKPLTKQVKTNLEYYNLWSDLKVYNFDNDSIQLLNGKPLEKLQPSESISNDKTRSEQEQQGNDREWIFPIGMDEKLTMSQTDFVFDCIRLVENERPKRIIAGMVNNDGTIVYYFIHDGIVRPRKS
ncbi:hypothetical protein PACTADRAFT_49586 [Pachysolen tannophilus NRRL Y-2460]|uniref:tRNA-splicing endonuclease subunit Sen15 domain-containing protein n=1 Tax=Pachysolen tannophilus NRRL Y-2460 TaxID=669874 RepID=A0A1E4TWT6_PACTA|nr:hypothetical protein PACTADRAFT_49586 [Pachysolen tannophilus NRRL Y-2460]